MLPQPARPAPVRRRRRAAPPSWPRAWPYRWQLACAALAAAGNARARRRCHAVRGCCAAAAATWPCTRPKAGASSWLAPLACGSLSSLRLGLRSQERRRRLPRLVQQALHPRGNLGERAGRHRWCTTARRARHRCRIPVRRQQERQQRRHQQAQAAGREHRRTQRLAPMHCAQAAWAHAAPCCHTEPTWHSWRCPWRAAGLEGTAWTCSSASLCQTRLPERARGRRRRWWRWQPQVPQGQAAALPPGSSLPLQRNAWQKLSCWSDSQLRRCSRNAPRPPMAHLHSPRAPAPRCQ